MQRLLQEPHKLINEHIIEIDVLEIQRRFQLHLQSERQKLKLAAKAETKERPLHS